ncbi:putative dienelactone hydrolase [Streptomyces sp. NBRC 110611]|uniref:dienelactone hydrolase family protein n=1 Tax=Streptomyces sp. NBRC 110611 TaxID=1621259 RepID=UPI000833326B|nr:dienelactone hydrolase family protein [Streptomyces sp. NBRC 110611]GAU71025.1 putative dienelactone hydrolase [Streptomyces sp. NBRC 110611]
MYDALLAETVTLTGHRGDLIEAYSARPLVPGPVGGVVVIHHTPGYDTGTKEITRRFAAEGFAAVCPNLYSREAPGADPGEAAAVARARGGVPDDRLLGDVAGAARYLRGLSSSNRRVGTIGYCSGGRQSFLAACSLDLQAAVDCYGGYVARRPPEDSPIAVEPILYLAKDLGCPLLGLFGAEDEHPSPAETAELRNELRKHGKVHAFHTYEGAGHAFFAVDRPGYRPQVAGEAWQRILEFFGRHLSG